MLLFVVLMSWQSLYENYCTNRSLPNYLKYKKVCMLIVIHRFKIISDIEMIN